MTDTQDTPIEHGENPQSPPQRAARSKWQKGCPFCSKKVPADARKCRHCGEILDEPGMKKFQPAKPQKTSGCVIAIIVCAVFFGIIMFVSVIAAIAIPNLLETKNAANEASAINQLRVLSAAQELFFTRYGRYATLEELEANDLINSRLAMACVKGQPYNGYFFDLRAYGDTWSCIALPSTPSSTGRRSFYIDQTGIIHYEEYTKESDEPANASSPSLGNW